MVKKSKDTKKLLRKQKRALRQRRKKKSSRSKSSSDVAAFIKEHNIFVNNNGNSNRDKEPKRQKPDRKFSKHRRPQCNECPSSSCSSSSNSSSSTSTSTSTSTNNCCAFSKSQSSSCSRRNGFPACGPSFSSCRSSCNRNDTSFSFSSSSSESCSKNKKKRGGNKDKRECDSCCLDPRKLAQLFRALPPGAVVHILLQSGNGTLQSANVTLTTGTPPNTTAQTLTVAPGLVGTVSLVCSGFIVLSPTLQALNTGANSTTPATPFGAAAVPVAVAIPPASVIGDTVIDLCRIEAVEILSTVGNPVGTIPRRFACRNC